MTANKNYIAGYKDGYRKGNADTTKNLNDMILNTKQTELNLLYAKEVIKSYTKASEQIVSLITSNDLTLEEIVHCLGEIEKKVGPAKLVLGLIVPEVKTEVVTDGSVLEGCDVVTEPNQAGAN